ncbi:MAG: tetratricopeptide repeat protein [Prevotella sp.]|nr:tetratricopeptide repeat protein [Prevotella sp.]
MNMKRTRAIIPLLLTLLFLVLAGCSSQKNTAKSRFWQSFTAKYNIYYNGTQAYIEGSQAKEDGNKDNYTEIIPLYTVGNKSSVQLGSGSFDKAIEKSQKAIKLHSISKRPEWTKSRRKTAKDIEWLNRREYNPMLWKAWMLMGRSQFHKGAFDEAAATFSYMSRLYQTQPAIYCKARAWLAKCYIEQDWLYDAEDVIRNMERDSIDWHATKEWNYTYADYYIHTGDYEKAIPYLRKVIKSEMRSKQRAREWYLMGQLEAELGNREKAYKAYKHVLKENPPYELAFNARIAMTEVMAAGSTKKTISRLKRMAASDNNKDYLDQVYYAMGNVYLLDKDTTNAIAAYEKGNTKATRSGVEKGVLLLKLGNLYWEKEKFGDAQRCYGAAIGMLDKERKDYEELSNRSKILDELAPHTEAIHLQDSLLELADMPEKERLEAIDRVIEALKKKEKEERKAQAEEAVQQQQGRGNTNVNNRQQNQQNAMQNQQQQQGEWYFYNALAVSQGKTTFQRQWGKRENEDNWRRSNKTVVSDFNAENMEGMEGTGEMGDSILAAQTAAEDSLATVQDSAQNDPHKREYYLKQIPFTDEQKQECHVIIADGLFHSGIIFKDKLDNLRLSEKQFDRLTFNYPEFEKMDEVYYHLFLLYSRKGETANADSCVAKLQEQFPESQWTKILTDPYFVENSKWGEQMEDSLYSATYNAFKADRHEEVMANAELSETRFPLGGNRDKFLFIRGLSRLNHDDAEGCLADMNEVVKNFPSGRISEMAGMIINGVKEGKRLKGGQFDLSDMWSRRSVVLNDSDSLAARKFNPDRLKEFVYVIAYHPDSLNENQLLYEMARFNFTTYIVRNFEIELEDLDGIHLMKVSGFRLFDEAHQYASEVHKQENVVRKLKKARTLIISKENLELLGKQFSFDDYNEFYAKHFAPLRLPSDNLLSEPYDYGDSEETDLKDAFEQNKTGGNEDMEDGFIIDNGGAGSPEDDGFELPDEESYDNKQGEPGNNVISVPEGPQGQGGIPDEDDVPTIPTDDDGFTIPTDDDGFTIPTDDDEFTIPTDDDGYTIPTDGNEINNSVVKPNSNNNSVEDDEYNLFESKRNPNSGKVPTKTDTKNNQKKVELPTDATPAKTGQNNRSSQSNRNNQSNRSNRSKQDAKNPEKPAEKPAKKPDPDPATIIPEDDDGFYFDIDPEPTSPTPKKKEKELQDIDLEDEYYDLDGF